MHPYLTEITQSNICFIDTETDAHGQMWSLQISTRPGTAAMIHYDQPQLLEFIASQVSRPDMLTVVHNAPFDLPVLKQVGIVPFKVADTMELAYLLQSEPQGLKPLAYRHAGMEMQSFTDVTADATRRKALQYLATAVKMKWPDPDPVLEWPKKGKHAGTYHIRQPQNIAKKIAGILRDSTTVAMDKQSRRVIEDGEGADPYDRWYKISPEDGRAMVERELGPLHQAYLQDIPTDKATYYSNRDPDATARVYYSLWPQIQALGLEEAFWSDMAAMPICLDMMESGILVDVPYLHSLSTFFETKLNAILADITSITGKTINPGSYQQVSDLLFKDLKIRTIKPFNKDGYHPTGDEILAQLVGEHKVVQRIRDYREYAKYRSTYTEKIPDMVDENGRLHCTLNMTRTSTGRLSSKNPNLQNIPVRKEDARKIRTGFIAQPGCSLVSIDYSQIELRLFAHYSQDPELLDVYLNDGDIHTKTGCHTFQMTPEELPDYPHRRSAKTTNFGVVYEITAQGLYEQFIKAGVEGWTVDDCQGFIDSWLGFYNRIINYRSKMHSHARQKGYVRDLSGRIRYVPGVRCKSRWLVLEALRQAGNMPIQGSAAYIIKRAMALMPDVYEHYRSQGYIINPLIQIHDELMFEIQDELLPVAIPVIRALMEGVVTLSVPVKCDVEVGKSWGELEHWEG